MAPPADSQKPSSPPRVLSLAWWVRDKNGGVTLAQWPNPALAVWLIAFFVGSSGILSAARNATVAGIGQGALVVWALDELVRGANPFRRLLGAAVLLWQLAHLFESP